MPDINDIVDRQRELLAARDKALLDQVSADYKRVMDRVFADLQTLRAQIEAAQAAGEDFSPSWIFRRDRLTDILKQAGTEYARFSAKATAETAREQLVQVRMSERHVLQMETAQLPERGLAQLGMTFNRLPTRAVEGLIGRASDGSPLKDLFDALGPALGAGLRDELIQAVAIGQAPRTTAQRIRELLAGNEARAQLIARTETIQAYREGAHLTSIENKSVLDGWIWITALDGRACAACVALNGTFHQLEERMTCHPACRCTKRFDTKSWRDLGITAGVGETRPPPVESGPAWFANVSRETRELILGKKGAAAWLNGDVTLKNFVGLKDDSRWGRSYFQRAFKDAIEGPQPGVVLHYTPFFIPPPLPPPPLPPPLPPPPPVIPPPPPAPVVAAPTPPAGAPPAPLTAAQARAEIERIAKADSDAATAELNRFYAQRDAIRDRLIRGEINNAEMMAQIKESEDAQKIWNNARLKARAALMREPLRVSDPLYLEPDWSLYRFKGSTSALRAAVRATHEQGIQDFRALVSDTMRTKATATQGGVAVNLNRVLIKTTSSDRSFAVHNTINMSFGAKEDTVVHELGHWLEWVNKDVRRAIGTFYEERTKGEKFVKLKKLFPTYAYKSTEITKVDKFIEAYMGKWYAIGGRQEASEILSMGLELFYRDPLRLARDDPDYFDFIYNLVRGQIPPAPAP